MYIIIIIILRNVKVFVIIIMQIMRKCITRPITAHKEESKQKCIIIKFKRVNLGS